MTEISLTPQQQAFLEECLIEFSDRYTDADEDFRKVCERGIPPPPIVYPWYTRNRHNNRDRPGGSRYDRRGDFRDYRDNRDQRPYENNYRNSGGHRYRPY